MSRTIFFAYESGHQENRDAINRGIADYNVHQKAFKAGTWEELKVGGHILNATVLGAIDQCEIFCCDLTYQNHNVLFELGYAIGKRKKLLVLLNPSVSSAKERYSSSKILKNIGYDEFQNGRDVLRSLQQRKHIDEVSIDSLINVSQHEADSHDLLFLSSAIENQAALDLSSYIDKLQARVIQNKSSEVDYQTLVWYVAGVVKCRNILIHLLGREKANTDAYNAEYSLFAGLGCGLGKSVMLLAPRPFKAPIDYSDILIEYDDSRDCLLKTSTWLESRLRQRGVESPVQLTEEQFVEQELNLLRLGIGYETAEEEENDLLEYFIEIDTYTRATDRTSCIITGRKGAGKTALFIRLREYFVQERGQSLHVILKPESDELIKSVELTRLYTNEQSKRALLTTAWRLVLFAGLFVEIHRRVSSQHPSTIELGSMEDRILKLADTNRAIFSLGHFSAMAQLYQQWDATGFGKPDALEQVYRSQLGPISDLVKEYFRQHRYAEVNILADNLDKTWDAKSDLHLQAEMILSLLEFCGLLARELESSQLRAHAVLILRTDIFECVMKHSREPDKLEARRLEVDWSRYPNRLKDLIEARFRFILKIPAASSVDHVWKDYFSLSRKRDPFDAIKGVVVARPRDMIYFVTKLFEGALNSGRVRVEEEDFAYAVDAYSNLLHQNMIAETRAEFPEVGDVFAEVQSRFYDGWLSYQELRHILQRFGYTDERIDQFLDFLFGKNYLIAVTDKSRAVIRNRKELSSALSERRLFFLRRHRVLVLLDPSRYRLRAPKHFA